MAKGKASFVISGDRELTGALARLEKKAGGKIMRRAVRDALGPVLADAKRRAPVETGAMRDTLKIRVPKEKRRGEIKIAVVTGTREELAAKTGRPEIVGQKGYYPAAVEFGTKNRPAKPWLRPALYENESRARQMVADGVRELLNSEKYRR